MPGQAPNVYAKLSRRKARSEMDALTLQREPRNNFSIEWGTSQKGLIAFFPFQEMPAIFMWLKLPCWNHMTTPLQTTADGSKGVHLTQEEKSCHVNLIHHVPLWHLDSESSPRPEMKPQGSGAARRLFVATADPAGRWKQAWFQLPYAIESKLLGLLEP